MLKILAQAAFSEFHQGRQFIRKSILFVGSPINPLTIFGNHHIQQLLKQRHSCTGNGLEILMVSLTNLRFGHQIFSFIFCE
ncbi:hypothetical protein MXB_4230 [Myxobolus squamalis]|nr:hypothetical protein MXB_4230 [Myxobolus squamalis]